MFMARLLSRLSLVGTNQVYRTWSRCRYPIRRRRSLPSSAAFFIAMTFCGRGFGAYNGGHVASSTPGGLGSLVADARRAADERPERVRLRYPAGPPVEGAGV